MTRPDDLVRARRPNHRLHALCPYFAMFPPSFARRQILRYTKRGDIVQDCYSGRGTTLLEATLRGRTAIASDINPVAYCVSGAKAGVPGVGAVWDELEGLEAAYERANVGWLEAARLQLPPFFRAAFSAETLRQLLFLRARLRWRDDELHRFITGLTLGHLHGESERSSLYCSKQMPHTISTKPRYSMAYWRQHGLRVPRRDVFELIADRADYRLGDKVPTGRAHVELCDVRQAGNRFRAYSGEVRLCVTSPPYLDTTRVEEDQWLRLWFLGGPPRPTYRRVSKDDRRVAASSYWQFLKEGWHSIAALLSPGAVIACRLGASGRPFAELRDGFLDTIRAVWTSVELVRRPTVTNIRRNQTALLHPKAGGCRFEVDFVVSVRRPRSSSRAAP